MKVTLYMAMSVNGIIARENGEEDFLSDYNWKSFVRLVKPIGSLIWGRKTYDTVQSWGEEYTNDIAEVRKIVLSEKGLLSNDSGNVATVASPEQALQQLEKEGFTEVILSGGSQINAVFAEKNLIDEVILSVESKIIGLGIPLFGRGDYELQLKPIKAEVVAGKWVNLYYKVIKSP